MKKLTAGDPETMSPDLLAANLERFKALFPELVAEGPDGPAVNVDVLKALVGDNTVTDADEKFGLNWHGKRQARQLALTPSTGTLRPCPEDSVDWDTTKNIIIEGDNLEVLKLLQKSYANRVKMIYIDPPYNTGKDFVYSDDFADSINNYLEITGQASGGEGKLISNTESSGRFHTAWLNMMHPRLKLARNLLRDDGIIFMSIDSTELANSRLLLNEIFGEECFVIELIWRKRDGAPNDRNIGAVHEYILVYGKTLSPGSGRTMAEESLNLMPRTQKADSEYQVFREPDGPDPRGRFRKIDTTANAKGGRDVASLHYGIINPYTKQKVYPRTGTCWRHSESEMKKLQQDRRLYWGVNGTATTPMRKLFLSEAKQGMTTPSILPDMPFNQHAARELELLFQQKSVFDTPKPQGLLDLLVNLGSSPGDLVLDFFAGSGTTGSACIEKAECSENRRYILVQLPEVLTPENSEQRIAADYCASLAKPLNQAELTKERLRRTKHKILEAMPLARSDIGFRVFRLDSSNIRAWEPDADNLDQTILDYTENIREGRTEQDILYELLLKLGLDLCVPIERREIAGKSVQSIGGGVLIACLAPEITSAEVEPLALGLVEWHQLLAPAGDTTCVFLDRAFSDDVAKTNLSAILNQHGLSNVRSL